MSENPYQAPQTVDSPAERAVGVVSGNPEDLRSVADYQRGMLICILVYLLGAPFGMALPPEMKFLVALPILGAAIGGMVFVFLLACKVYNPLLGVLLGILTLVPCLGLLMLLVVNGKATGILKANDIRVGLLGANSSDLKRRLS